ncbi:TetR/AcrR family transcriptional regulator [Rhodococcus sp. 1R11]|uniref:TetR/AcrR family transcriptional regulator n=1 Tax=Rhodococcus sp. 1R11 TaxID=2559614 RepID=UPI001072D07A|nr:TetR/AcrR family transcriptional regulator [Rhodococcus sp. 1R11]TFI43675.1 TetR/AcrR family transcriptional regulator [Rhodococcus sp. 1R11]
METRERLIASMQELLWENGYAGTSPRAVQKLAGTRQSSMYHFFDGKSELAVAAEYRMSEELKAQITERLASGNSARDKVAAFLSIDENVLRGCRLGRLVQDAEVASNDALREPIQEMFEWIQASIGEVLHRAHAAGELPADLDVEALSTAVLALRQGAYVLARGAQSPEPFRRAVIGILQLIPSTQATG